MASEETRPQSGNTSGESKGSSRGKTSMLELLTITDAAVKALNKSTHSTSSQGSKKSQFSDQRCQSIQGESSRSGHSIHSDRSEKSAHSQLISNRSLKSAHSCQLDSDRSVHSRQSAASGQSTQSHQSNQFVQSYHSDQSQRSGRSVGDAKGTLRIEDTSHDSGVVSKTHTVSEEKSKSWGVNLTSPTEGSLHEQSSDVSTTASDILIKSTLDKSERSILADGHHRNNGSSSGSSKCSKTSFGVENFNSSGPHKVKISRKHLREIKAPFEDVSPRSSSSSDGKVPHALLGVNGKQSARSNTSEIVKMKGTIIQRKDADREVVTTSNESNGDKFPLGRSFPRGITSDDQFKVEKVRKSADKAYEDVNMVTKSKPKTNGHILRADLEMKSQSSTGSSKTVDVATEIHVKESMHKLNINDSKYMQFRSTPKYYVERHTPQKSQMRIEDPVTNETMPERKNLLQDLEDSVEIITAHGTSRDTSGSSSQPEIVTVPERIVTVTAWNSVSPASSVGDLVTKTTPPTETYHSAGYKLRDDKGPEWKEKGKTLDDSNIIPPALSRQYDDVDNLKTTESRPIPPRFQWFSRQATGHGLQQGAPVNGLEAPDRHKDEDVHISDFKLTEKQKMAKDIFAKRQGGPIRRVVQPRIVGHDSKASSTSSTGALKCQHLQLGQANDQVLTAAAAASAAVAATQPFLKAQQDMELKMAEVLARIGDLQSGASQKPGESEKAPDRVQQLEKQLADMTDKRIEYMERLQEQQIAMQAKLLSMTRESTTFRPYQPRSYSPEPHPASVTNKAFSKTTISRQPNMGDYSNIKHSALDLDKEESSSPLDTPAPRARAPRPTIYDTSDIEYRVGRSRSPKARSIKVRSPKPKSRSPAKENLDRGILHQILASADSPVRDGGHRAPPAVQCR